MPVESEQPGASGDQAGFQISRSMVFPLVGGRSTWRQEHLLPIFVTLVVGIALFGIPYPWPQIVIKGQPAPAEINAAWQAFSIIGLYIAFMVNYYINQMCGRPRSGWMLAVVAVSTFLLLSLPLWSYWFGFFYYVIPGNRLEKSADAVVRLAGYFFGTGLCEEGFKSLPLFALALLGAGLAHLSRHRKGKPSARLAGLRKRICLCEPLDGIVFGVASGSGFFLNETLGQYVPKAMSKVKYPAAQAFDGLLVLLGRGLPDLAEHSAWAGLFGYFIGLSVLQPRMAIVLLPLGWLSAAVLHAGWDGIGAVTDNGLIIIVFWTLLGLLSYALLAGAIFKARDISPRLALEPAPGAPAQAAGSAAALIRATTPVAAFEAPDGD